MHIICVSEYELSTKIFVRRTNIRKWYGILRERVLIEP